MWKRRIHNKISTLHVYRGVIARYIARKLTCYCSMYHMLDITANIVKASHMKKSLFAKANNFLRWIPNHGGFWIWEINSKTFSNFFFSFASASIFSQTERKEEEKMLRESHLFSSKHKMCFCCRSRSVAHIPTTFPLHPFHFFSIFLSRLSRRKENFLSTLSRNFVFFPSFFWPSVRSFSGKFSAFL